MAGELFNFELSLCIRSADLRSEGGRLGMIVYGWDGAAAMRELFNSGDMGEGSGAVAWLAGDVNGDGKTELVQLWDNAGGLEMIVYGSDGAGGYHELFNSFPLGGMGEGSGAVAWLTADVNGDGKAEIVQLWDNTEDNFNAVRFFSDMSHGNLDLSGSRVFGWYLLDVNVNDVVPPTDPPPPGWTQTTSQGEMIDLAK